MEIVGFIALLIVGLWLVVAGFGSAFAAYGLTGKIVLPPIIFGIGGIVVLYFAFINSPFSVVVN